VREPGTATALWAELRVAGQGHADIDAAVAALHAPLHDPKTVDEAGARQLVERLAPGLQAAVLLRAGSPAAGVFCRSRLGGSHGLTLGTLPAGVPFAELIDRALPAR